MTKEITPRPFRLENENSVVEIADVALHQSIEADADGRIFELVWIEGRATSKLDHDVMTVELEFALYAGDKRLGACSPGPLEIDGERKTIAFKAEGGLRIPRNVEVSKIAMRVATTIVNRFDPVDLNPQPLPPIAQD